MTIGEDICDELYRILGAEVKKCGAKPLRINGIGNHIHLLVDFGPKTCREVLLKTIKQNSSLWGRKSGKIPQWEGWGKEYYCFSVSSDRKERVINYINRQKEHHNSQSFEEEVRWITECAGVEWKDNMLYD